MLMGVQLADVDRDEPHVRVCERRLRHRREVAETGADGDHEVGFAGRLIGGGFPVTPIEPNANG